MSAVDGEGGESGGGAQARELAAVPEVERWQRVADLAAAHADDDLAGDGDPWGPEP